MAVGDLGSRRGAVFRAVARMRVAAVRLLASALASTPVVGWLRPVILVPVEVLTGMPTEQMRALLADELAHILRRDDLVNILQSVAEAALFYRPAEEMRAAAALAEGSGRQNRRARRCRYRSGRRRSGAVGGHPEVVNWREAPRPAPDLPAVQELPTVLAVASYR